MDITTLFVVILFLALTYFSSGVVTYVIRRIKYAAKKTQTQLDDIFTNAILSPLRMIVILGGVFYTLYYINPFFTLFGADMFDFLTYIVIFFTAFLLSKLIKSLLIWSHGQKNFKVKLDGTIFKFVTNSVNIIIYLITIIIILQLMGIQIGPMLAGLGIAGIAVALALQESLSNLFAALYIVFSRPVRVGQFIELESPEIAGYIREIDWRSTKIETIGGNFYIIPNSKLSQSIIKNYSEPIKRISVVIPMGVAYGSNLEKVEKICIQIGNRLKKKLSTLDHSFDTLVRFKEFGNSSINFIVILKAVEYSEQYFAKHEYVKAIFKEFKKQKIEIPFPQMDLYIKQHKRK